MPVIAPPPADSADSRKDFAELAQLLPPFRSGVMPVQAADYLAFYGLDFSAGFPGCRHALGTVASGDFHIALHCWELPGASATLHLVHGYFDHVGLYRHLVRFGLEQGLNVVAFDLPGHGLSSGPRAEIEDFAEYREALTGVLAATAFLPGPRYVIAQSTGGAAVMDFLQKENPGQPAFQRVVLLAPLVWPHGWRRVKLAWLALHRFVDAVPRRFAENSQDPEFLAFLRADPLQHMTIPVCWIGALRRWLQEFLRRPPCPQPLLVLQGDADGTVDWRRNLRKIAALFPAAQIETITTARHHLVNEDRHVREDLLGRIERYLRSAPSAGRLRHQQRAG